MCAMNTIYLPPLPLELYSPPPRIPPCLFVCTEEDAAVQGELWWMWNGLETIQYFHACPNTLQIHVLAAILLYPGICLDNVCMHSIYLQLSIPAYIYSVRCDL